MGGLDCSSVLAKIISLCVHAGARLRHEFVALLPEKRQQTCQGRIRVGKQRALMVRATAKPPVRASVKMQVNNYPSLCRCSGIINDRLTFERRRLASLSLHSQTARVCARGQDCPNEK